MTQVVLSFWRSRVGMVFQHFDLYPHISVLENLCLAQQKVLTRSREEAVERGVTVQLAEATMKHWTAYYNQSRPHSSMSTDIPIRISDKGRRVVRLPISFKSDDQ